MNICNIILYNIKIFKSELDANNDTYIIAVNRTYFTKFNNVATYKNYKKKDKVQSAVTFSIIKLRNNFLYVQNIGIVN